MKLPCSLLALACLALAPAVFAAEAPPAPGRVAIVVGPSTHPPGSHEVQAGGRLLEHCLKNITGGPRLTADVFYEWPKDDAVRAAASTIVFIGDQFPPQRLPDAAANLAQLETMMQRGCGIVCVHYATGLAAGDVPPDGAHPLLRWLGGYFATKCAHHQSIAKIYEAATITPAAPEHPVARGWREFTLRDEPYIQNYFGPEGNRLAPNAIAFATSMLPPEAPQREVVAWGVERADGGRGFGIVMPHFYRNWTNEDLRRFILNGIVWTAKLEVPATGVQTTLPDLATFAPESVDPKPRVPQPK